MESLSLISSQVMQATISDFPYDRASNSKSFSRHNSARYDPVFFCGLFSQLLALDDLSLEKFVVRLYARLKLL